MCAASFWVITQMWLALFPESLQFSYDIKVKRILDVLCFEFFVDIFVLKSGNKREKENSVMKQSLMPQIVYQRRIV
jgi:hypothetical protein